MLLERVYYFILLLGCPDRRFAPNVSLDLLGLHLKSFFLIPNVRRLLNNLITLILDTPRSTFLKMLCFSVGSEIGGTSRDETLSFIEGMKDLTKARRIVQ